MHFRQWKRREFITLRSAAWPLAVRAQQPVIPVVGFLSGRARRLSIGRRTHHEKHPLAH
jgi:hypothetical protein